MWIFTRLLGLPPLQEDTPPAGIQTGSESCAAGKFRSRQMSIEREQGDPANLPYHYCLDTRNLRRRAAKFIGKNVNVRSIFSVL